MRFNFPFKYWLFIALLSVLFIIFINLPKKATLQIKGTTLKILYAKSISEKEKGLSGKLNESMLFDFTSDTNKRPTFWMKDMLYDLDVVWIKDAKIIKIEKDIKKPAPKEEPVVFYPPNVDIDYVLELPAGKVAEYNLLLNDPVIIRVP